ncbi:MAG: glucose 1-dehydrogenase [Alphaproteobacteria bacterium]|nr:glucose 1-dehydrogenase [Alphaproteobacteria bacterium]
MARLSGKVALITGAGMGIGETEAILFAQEGAKVIATDINEEAGLDTVKKIEKAGYKAEFMKLDVRNESEWQQVTKAILEKYGKLDVLVNNAGILLLKPLEETSEEEWRHVFQVNVMGVFFGCKHAVEGMKKAGGGSIINIASVYGIIGAPNAAAYEASKGAVRALTKAAAADLAKYKIRVNSVHPGLIDTPMTQDTIKNPEKTKELLLTTIMEHPGKSEEVALPVLMLASDESSYMTGSELIIDGGYTAR